MNTLLSNEQSQRIIIINPYLYNQLGPAASSFVNAHKCAHHYYGHVDKMTHRIPRNEYTDEFDADCFAIKFLRDRNQMSQYDFDQIKNFLITQQADNSHPVGYDRIQYAIQCVNSYWIKESSNYPNSGLFFPWFLFHDIF